MLILALSLRNGRDGKSIANTIADRMRMLRKGKIAPLYHTTMAVSTWSVPKPSQAGNSSTTIQGLMDVGNMRSATSLA